MKLVTTAAMAEIDRVSQDDYSIPDLLLMEQAGMKCYQRASAIIGSSGYRAELRTPSDGGVSGGPRFPGRQGAVAPESETVRAGLNGPSKGSSNLRLVFVCGKGNNAGDALVMARHFAVESDHDITIVLGLESLGALAERQREMCAALGLRFVSWDEERRGAAQAIAGADWLFDGLAGTGIRGALRSPLTEIVEAVNDSPAPVIAIDTPSGVADRFESGSTVVRAAHTLTVGLPKQCLYYPATRPYCGTITVVPIGFPRTLTTDETIPGEVLQSEDLDVLTGPIAPWTYKTKRGHLAVFAGASGTTGAAILTATAAARCRTGLVTLHLDAEAYAVAAGQCRSLMPRPWNPEDEPATLVPGPFTGCLVGPGWGKSSDRIRWLTALVNSGLPGVLDADGLNILADSFSGPSADALNFGGTWVLTPHPGEFSRLSGIGTAELLASPVEPLLERCRALNAVIALKGHVTFIGTPDGRFSVVDGMNAAMATGGTGDILAGIIAGYLSSGLSAYDAARAGVLLHDAIGREAFARDGWFISEDLLPYISLVRARHETQGGAP